MLKKQESINIFSVISFFVLTLGLCWSVYHIFECRNEERLASSREAEYKQLGFDLEQASDFLTAEVRKFAVTLNPVHLINYWEEVNVKQTRERVINRMKELGAPENEFNLLQQAKQNSDALVNTETRAMRLILEVYEVPESQMEPAVRDYQLKMEDQQLDFNAKVNKAREILYDRNYSWDKKSIVFPIHEFQKVMRARVQEETQVAQRATNRALAILCLMIGAVVVYLAAIAWVILYKISVPLKTLLEYSKEQKQKARNHVGTDVIQELELALFSEHQKN